MSDLFASLRLDTEAKATLFLNDPYTQVPLVDAEGRKAFITLHTPESPAGRRTIAELTAASDRYKRRNKNQDMPASELMRWVAIRAARLTVDWHLVGLDGQAIQVACNEENALQLYSEPELSWISAQVTDFLSEPSNFDSRLKRAPESGPKDTSEPKRAAKG